MEKVNKPNSKINSILIANRGEIAIRISRTAKKMGIKTYVFLTHQEPNAHYLDFADEIIDISADTFTNIFMSVEKIVEFAVKYKIDAVHPGYGFLSENPFLPKECKERRIIFIGPSHEIVDYMGNKGIARRIATENKIPILPGSNGSISSLENAKQVAEEIGYPVIIKAVAGGGGKGMRISKSAKDISFMYNIAVNEAKSVFNNASVFIEKYVENPRHVEFQVLGDMHGSIVHLFDRECSIQRKHQKLLEEAPSPALNNVQRIRIGADAVKLCKSVGYYSAGTVEFLLDDEGNHYFMEMNTRVQVEHPVTEEITGIDIIEQQILIAQGNKLALNQEDISINGCAIEFRINAEDVQADFSPSTGIVDKIELKESKNIRFDSGYNSGKIMPSCFDSLVAKLIVKAATREEAIKLSLKAINEAKIKGIKTTLPFFKMVLQNNAFCSGNYTTSFLEKEISKLFYQEDDEFNAAVSLAMTAYLSELESIDTEVKKEKKISPWVLSKYLSK
jgi:acetyl/propionyl-CoA carboxylase alpha subunit